MELSPLEASNQADESNFQPLTMTGGPVNDRKRRLEHEEEEVKEGELEESTVSGIALNNGYSPPAIKRLQPDGQFSDDDLKKSKTSSSQSTSQSDDDTSDDVEGELEESTVHTIPFNFEHFQSPMDRLESEWQFLDDNLKKSLSSASRLTSQQQDDDTSDSVQLQFSGVRMNQGVQDQQKIVLFNEGLPINIKKSKEISLAGRCPITEFLSKFDSEVTSIDFAGILDEERVQVDRYSFPISLRPIVDRIKDAYGDITERVRLSAAIAGLAYVLICAMINEMDHLQLEQVTENHLLKWREIIRNAFLFNFEVGFALDHFKKIAHAYVGLVLRQQLKSVASTISKLEADWKASEEADLNVAKEEHAKLAEQSKLFAEFVDEFSCKYVSAGLFP